MAQSHTSGRTTSQGADQTLNDPTYSTDNHLDLTPGSADCIAITNGVAAATSPFSLSLLTSFFSNGLLSTVDTMLNGINSLDGLDKPAIAACFPGKSGSLENGNTYAVNADGSVTIGDTQNGSTVLTTLGSGNDFLTITAQNVDGANGALIQAGAPSYLVGVSATPDANGDGGSSIRFQTPQEMATLSGTYIDPTQITPTGNGALTLGSPHADASGYTNQLSLAGTASFGISSLNITDPTTGQTSTVALNNGSNTTLQEGRSAATGAPNEQVQTPNADGSQQDAIFGQGAQANVNNTAVTLASGTQATVVGNNNTVADDTSAPLQQGRSVAIDGNANTYKGAIGDSAQLSGSGNATNNVSNVILVGDGSNATTTGGGTVQLTASDQVLSADANSVVNVLPSLNN